MKKIMPGKGEVLGKGGEKFLDVLKTIDLSIGSLIFHEPNKDFEKISVHDPAQPPGKQNRDGQFFISLPSKLAETLPGTTLYLEQFFSQPGHYYSDPVRSRLEGDHEGSWDNLGFSSHEIFDTHGQFKVKVFHGRDNKHAKRLKELAPSIVDQTLTDEQKLQVRAEYQKEEFQVMKPIMEMKSDSTDIRIEEDCIASGDTLVGVIATLLTRTKLEDRKKIRIDVAVATTQGMMVLRKFAHDNSLQLELNIGFLADSLSEGEKDPESGVKIHANYIMDSRDDKFVVGDMGDAAKSLPEGYDINYPWNKFRDDLHGDRNHQKLTEKTIDPNKPLFVFLTNGGYLTEAFIDELNLKGDSDYLIMMAKRVWSDEERFGYGVLIDEIPKELLKERY